VFRTARYLFREKDLVSGDVEHQYSFTSSTFDNHINPYGFMDVFSACCVYVIKIPKGSRGLLIIDRNSTFADEHEVLLGYNAELQIDDVQYEQVTYVDVIDPTNIWFNEMKTYFATFVPGKYKAKPKPA